MNESMLIGLLIGASVFVILTRFAVLEKRLNRLSRLDAKVDAMRDVPVGVREALHQGETILAIKRFREATGAGLKEAKDFVDEVRRRQTATS